MMQLKACKAVLAGLLLSVSGSALALPVADPTVNASVQMSSQNMVESIRSQTESIVNSLDYVTDALAKVITDTAANTVKTETSLKTMEEYSDKVSKSMVACTQYKTAGVRAAVVKGRTADARHAFAVEAHEENMRSQLLAHGEPRQDYFDSEVLARLVDPESDTNRNTAKAFSGEPITPEDYAAIKDAVLYATNPYPIALPSRAELDEIEAHGNPGEKNSYARVLVNNHRQKLMQDIVEAEVQNNVQTLKADDFEYLLKHFPLTKADREKYSDKLSKNQVDHLMATFRVTSPSWVAKIHSATSTKGLQVEQAMIQAEILNQLYQLNSTNKLILRVLALSESNRLNQTGATTN